MKLKKETGKYGVNWTLTDVPYDIPDVRVDKPGSYGSPLKSELGSVVISDIYFAHVRLHIDSRIEDNATPEEAMGVIHARIAAAREIIAEAKANDGEIQVIDKEEIRAFRTFYRNSPNELIKLD